MTATAYEAGIYNDGITAVVSFVLDAFVDGWREMVDGYVGFYWGKTIDEYIQEKDDIAAGIMAEWLEYFCAQASVIAK